MESKTYSIPNISCMHCVNKIQETILALEGVDFAEADPTSKQLEVELKLQRSTDQRSGLRSDSRQISMSERTSQPARNWNDLCQLRCISRTRAKTH